MIQCMQIVIVEDNVQLAEAIRSYFIKKDVFEITGIAHNSMEAIALLKEISPDVIILDLVMPRSDGFVLLEHLNTMESEKKPEVLVLSSLSHESIIKRACDLGAIYYMVKPFTMEDLHNRVRDILGTRSTAQATPNLPIPDLPTHDLPTHDLPIVDITLDQRIAELFLNIGIPSQNKGYQYLVEAIKMVIERPYLINNITKKLYPGIGVQHNTNPMNVERSMRHAIEVAWISGKLQNINGIFNCIVFSPQYKPANGEFISIISTRLMNSSN